MNGFEEWFGQFRDRHRGWEVDEVKTWLKAAWDAGFASAAPADEVPDAITAWADDARISASEFMALGEDKRRALLDQYCDRLDGEQS